jgi:hypothetical protein
MRFSWQRSCMPLRTLGGLVVFGVGLLLGCQDNITTQDEVLGDARARVEANVLPVLVGKPGEEKSSEVAAVLRNLVHLLAVLPEICATPLARLGTFASSLPTLQAPTQPITFNNTDGRWEITWQDRILGDADAALTVDTATPRVDMTLTVRFRSQALQTLRAIPFSLVPQTDLTADPPATFAAEGFFLFQDRDSGLWTLRWSSPTTTKVFEGRITATALTRVIRRVVADTDGVNNAVTSLAVSATANEITFQETTDVMHQKGFTFFAQPGDTVTFRLRIGTSVNTLQSITREQLRLGGGEPPQRLPADLSPTEFRLVSNLPIDPIGAPLCPPGTNPGTFICQEAPSSNTCNAGEDQWRLRFRKQAGATTFSGVVRSFDVPVRLRTTAVGACPAGRLDDADHTFTYDCTLSDDTLSGYDICVTAGKRLDFTPEVGGIRDPRFVFIGLAEEAPPSPDPFTILFDLDLAERQSSRNVRFSEGNVVLRGNNETTGAVRLNPDHVSLEPLCGRLSTEVESVVGVVSAVQPKVRLTGRGDYATTRFEGGAYILDNVEFADDNVNTLANFQRFPDRGDIRLQTRVEAEDATVTAAMEELEEIVSLPNNQARTTVDVDLRVNGVLFTFPNRRVGLTVE